MARRKQEAEEENSERWLLTYSDLITLLLALFIILYSMAQIDAQKFNAIAAQFREQIGDASDAGNAPYMDPPGSDTASSGADALNEVYEQLKEYVDQNGLGDQVSLEATDNYVRIRIKDAIMFLPDSPVLLEASRPVLENLEGIIGQVYDEIDNITFTGHTADAGDHSATSDQISWHLSTERAMTVLDNFVANGLPPEKLSVEGYAYYQPIADNGTEDGMAQNRRVEITVFREPAGSGADTEFPSP